MTESSDGGLSRSDVSRSGPSEGVGAATPSIAAIIIHATRDRRPFASPVIDATPLPSSFRRNATRVWPFGVGWGAAPRQPCIPATMA